MIWICSIPDHICELHNMFVLDWRPCHESPPHLQLHQVTPNILNSKGNPSKVHHLKHKLFLWSSHLKLKPKEVLIKVGRYLSFQFNLQVIELVWVIAATSHPTVIAAPSSTWATTSAPATTTTSPPTPWLWLLDGGLCSRLLPTVSANQLLGRRKYIQYRSPYILEIAPWEPVSELATYKQNVTIRTTAFIPTGLDYGLHEPFDVHSTRLKAPSSFKLKKCNNNICIYLEKKCNEIRIFSTTEGNPQHVKL